MQMTDENRIKPNYRPKDNENCPCRSGEPFGKCCKSKNNEYYSLGKNYQNRKVIVNLTKSNARFEKVHQILFEITYTYGSSSISISKAIEYLKTLYSLLQDDIDEIKSYIPCNKGCSYCCYSLMLSTAIEAEYIRQYIKADFTEEQKNELLSYLRSNYDPEYSFKRLYELDEKGLNIAGKEYLKKILPCPFLKGDVCLIYEVRPFACRKHMVLSEAINCASGSRKEKRAQLQLFNPVRIGLDVMMQPVERYKGLWDKRTYPSTSIVKTVYEWFSKGFNGIDLEGL
ncbi:MAG: YkgJ family cysteine cluster protein [Clostridia bacterium]|nr:YkgJ family cysteine cluster protein [Clostridia bacterium]